jgi:hypothetical protein
MANETAPATPAEALAAVEARVEAETPAPVAPVVIETPLVAEADPEIEALLAEEFVPAEETTSELNLWDQTVLWFSNPEHALIVTALVVLVLVIVAIVAL